MGKKRKFRDVFKYSAKIIEVMDKDYKVKFNEDYNDLDINLEENYIVEKILCVFEY